MVPVEIQGLLTRQNGSGRNRSKNLRVTTNWDLQSLHRVRERLGASSEDCYT